MERSCSFPRLARAALERPDVFFWVTAQGNFVDPRHRPVTIKPGVGHAAAVAKRGLIIPFALEYPFWNERLPEAIVSFGTPHRIDQHTERDADTWNRILEKSLEETQDELRDAAIARNSDAFTELASALSALEVRTTSYDAFAPHFLENIQPGTRRGVIVTDAEVVLSCIALTACFFAAIPAALTWQNLKIFCTSPKAEPSEPVSYLYLPETRNTLSMVLFATSWPAKTWNSNLLYLMTPVPIRQRNVSQWSDQDQRVRLVSGKTPARMVRKATRLLPASRVRSL